ncbi:hypothetical protein BJV82DRAFT_610973 [Fennellomyces sp. T-0311]|nr:hypothetical protein BJV82DRAFT_610973 [Fennellomyces sp. T-0311]
MRVHHGAVDRSALTSRAPTEVISEIRQTLQALGIDCKPDGEYKLKCSRRPAKTFAAREEEEPKEESNSVYSLFPNPGRLSATSSWDEEGATSLLTISTDSPLDQQSHQPIYGDPTIDSGEEIRFVVEICRFRNLPGLYIADVRRLRGNVWVYKFIYDKLIHLLAFKFFKSGYYTRADQVVQKSPFFQQDDPINKDSAIGSCVSP